MKPKRSYTIWFAQRTGSTLLCKALEDTKAAGKPNEWLAQCAGIDGFDIDKDLWEKGLTPNGVFGIKFSFYRPCFDNVISMLKKYSLKKGLSSEIDIWNDVFPECRHVFMTRRNKIRMAVSWWRAIQSGLWHKKHGVYPVSVDLSDKYSYDAINHLYNECSMREAGIQELFDQAGIIPLNIVYEDFIKSFDKTVMDVLSFIDIPVPDDLHIIKPYYGKIADDVSESWVQRFREDRQRGWENKGW